MYQMARMSVEDGLVMTIHPGSYRNHHEPTFEKFGADTGHDIPFAVNYTEAIRPLLQDFGTAKDFHLVLFTLDETVFSRELAPLAGFYPSVYLGAPWWFLDAPDAMLRFRSAVTETAGFSRSSGFIDDTRAFCSIPARHDASRRIEAVLPGPAGGRAPRQRGPRPRTDRRRRRLLAAKGLQAVSTEPERTRRDFPSLNRAVTPLAPSRRCGSSTWALAPSTARTRRWYTQQAGDAADWGIAAFTGRRPDAAAALAEQDGLYTVVERADAGDSFAVVGSIVEAVDGADVQRLADWSPRRRPPWSP